jgi:hypothetical protein
MPLLVAIFDELSTQLGQEFSTAELMQAAQGLVELSKQEFLVKHEQAQGRRSTFYSMDLVTAFDSHIWRIATSDTSRLSHCDFDEFSPETLQNATLVLQGAHERLWEF